jgi:hypothetical protein
MRRGSRLDEARILADAPWADAPWADAPWADAPWILVIRE